MLELYQLPCDLSTVVLVEDGVAYTKSTAILRSMNRLGAGWSCLAWLGLHCVPRCIRDFFYGVIARNRGRIWVCVKKICCMGNTDVECKRDRFVGLAGKTIEQALASAVP